MPATHRLAVGDFLKFEILLSCQRRDLLAVCDFEDPSAGAVDAGVFVALAGVGPVEEIDGAVGAGGEVDAAEEGVAGEEEVLTVFGDVAGALAFEDFLVGAFAVEVEGEEVAAVLLGPVLALVDHHADVGVAAAELVGGTVAGFGPVAFRVEVPVVGMHVEVLVGVGIGVDGVGADVAGSGDAVPEVAVDGVDEEEFAVFVPIMAPGIGGAAVEGFEDLALGVVAPDGAAEGDAVVVGGAGETDFAGGGGPAAAVEPAVGAPAEAVGKVVVVGGGDREAVEDGFGGAVGEVVAVAVGDEEEAGRAHEPEAVGGPLDAGEVGELVGEDDGFVGFAVVVGIGEDEDAVAVAGIELFAGQFVESVVFGDPEAARGVPGAGDGVADLGFGGEDGDVEAVGDAEGGGGFGGREGFAGDLFGVDGGGEGLGGEGGEREEEQQEAHLNDPLCWREGREGWSWSGGESRGAIGGGAGLVEGRTGGSTFLSKGGA